MFGQRNDILMVGQLPPPYHGQSVVTQLLFAAKWSSFSACFLRMQYSSTIEQVGGVHIRKIFHLLELVLKTYWIAISRQPKVLYYLPASPHAVPIIRDVIYLACVRWLFPRVVFHYHAGGLVEYVERLSLFQREILRKVYGGAEISIELSPYGQSPSEYFFARKKRYIPNGLKIPAKREFPKNAKKIFNVLYVGSLSESKGILLLVETLRLIIQQGREVKFTVVGAWASKSFSEVVHGKVEEYQLQEYIDFTGPLSGDSKWLRYECTDCFLFPSHYESESFPLVLIEAMAFSLPIVTTHWRGIPNLIGNDENAILCNVRSPSEYADSILDLMNDESKRIAYGDSAHRKYLDEYTDEVFLCRMNEVFVGLV